MTDGRASTRRRKLELRVARILASFREAKSVSQDSLGRKLGHDQSFVSRLERGERRATVAELVQWAIALRVPFDEVMIELRKVWVDAGGTVPDDEPSGPAR